MARLILLLVFIILTKASFCQDSLVLYKEITFSSLFEKKSFDNHFIHQKTDLFDLLMANGGLLNEGRIASSKEGFYSHLDNMGFEKMTTRKNDRQVKFVYDNIHKKFLQKYEERNKYEEIFSNGFYNCVSASALYALAFDRLKIPYTIKEKPTHVYLIAYPGAENIMIETTTPVGGFYQISTPFKQNFVKTLKDQKLISAQEFNAYDVNVLFERYYFGKQEEINLLQLVGLHYLNDGLYKMDDGLAESALHQFEKAFLFYPSDRTGYLMMVAATDAFHAKKEKDNNHAILLAKLSRYQKYGVTPEMIKGEFGRVLLDLIPQADKRDQLNSYYQTLYSGISTDELRKEIDFLYHYEFGRQLYHQLRYKEALTHFEKAVQAKPKSTDALNAFMGCLGHTLSAQNNNKEAIGTLEKYGSIYPDLKVNNLYSIMLASAFLSQFGQEYELNRPGEGDKYKTAFEMIKDNNQDLPINHSLIGYAYSSAAVYFFRRGQTAKAKNIINKGLEYSPNNPELMIRLEMLR
ncbi:MAG: hypothetical protein KF846_00845 [Cyclobacteriaceae bacterium]|nr:hypothetical protein [Cyclobacteriaceae bacterium]